MEDVDAALVDRKPGRDQSGSNNVTLSGILNSLDGITAQQGSVVFMTTNHITRLAPALIRPGRCDPDNELKSAACLTSSSTSYDLINTAELDHDEQARKEGYDAMIYKIADQVGEMITYEDSVSTAQLQEFLMLHRNEPETILDKMPGFLNEVARERRAPLGKGEAKKADNKEKVKEEKVKVDKKEESIQSLNININFACALSNQNRTTARPDDVLDITPADPSRFTNTTLRVINPTVIHNSTVPAVDKSKWNQQKNLGDLED
ncbi:hypothetical protein BGZ49_006449 [Haplosporangium sp. Z 27]|nr:hypothetical protein BGZ49_006449 [Haplosporangium sp. Z 27]